MATRSPITLEITTFELQLPGSPPWRSELLVNDQRVVYFDEATEIEAFRRTEAHVRKALGGL